MGGRPLLTLTMIVRDESANLRRSLASVEGVVDEIVVADTGSSDDTVEIARSLGARVIEIPWEDSFAVARNRALELASGQWAMFLDADEEFPTASGAELRDFLASTDASAVSVLLTNAGLSGQLADSFPTLRVWRNRPDFRFVGRVHEQLDFQGADLEPNFRALTNLVITHHGYAADEGSLREKGRRNEELLKLALEEDPDDFVSLFYLAKTRDAEGLLEEARELYRRAVRADRDGTLPAARRNLIACLGNLGEFSEAQTAARHAIKAYPDYPDLWYYLGRIELELGRPAEAVRAFERAAALAGGPVRYPSMPATATTLAWLGMADALQALGRGPEAAQWRSRAAAAEQVG